MPRIDEHKTLIQNARAAAPKAAKADSTAAAPAEKAASFAQDIFKGLGIAKSVGVAAEPEKKSWFGKLWDGVKDKASSAWDWVKEKTSVAGQAIGDGFMKVIFGAASYEFKTRNVYDNPTDVNHPSEAEKTDAKAKLEANQAKVEVALGKLSPEERKQYEAVSAQTVGRPTCQLALQTMLLDGRLTKGKDVKGEGSALAHLAKLSSQDLAKGVERRQLVSEVIGELENPVRINQHSVGTCGATTAQILLIRQNPAEYVRLMEGLASPAGKATMAGGDTIERVEDWADDGDGGRTMSSRLFQPAVMDFGEPLPGDRYDNSEDRGKLGPIPLFSGLMGLQSICTQLTGKSYDGTTAFPWNHDSMWNDIKAALDAKKGPIPVSLRWNTDGTAGGHFVQIDKIENGKAYITNPWGQRESFSEEEFRSHLTSSYIPE